MNATEAISLCISLLLIASGLGMLFSKATYEKIYSRIQHEPTAVLLAGMLSVIVGVGIVAVHSFWSSPLQILISLMGFGALIKGFVLIVFPACAMKMLQKYSALPQKPFAAILVMAGVGLFYSAGLFSTELFFS